MCTAITMVSKQGENFFGRTMDFSHPIEPGLYVIPRNYEWYSLSNGRKLLDHYSFISMGQETDGMLGFFEGVNECGFACATLYFSGYAYYDLPTKGKEPIAALDFLHFLLGRCNSIKDLYILINNITIVGVEDPVTNTAAPLHWIATDRSGKCVVIEQTKDRGLEIIENPIGVMANSPDFRWHMTNLRNYLDVTNTQEKEVYWGDVLLTPFGQASGTMHLPGGYTSPERFVRTSFIRSHVPTPKDRIEAIMTCFHVVNSVTIPKGIALTDNHSDDYTKYIAFINTKTCEYFFKTYENNQIFTASLYDYQEYSKKPIFLGNIIKPVSFLQF